jgi:hypothetical protein
MGWKLKELLSRIDAGILRLGIVIRLPGRDSSKPKVAIWQKTISQKK